MMFRWSDGGGESDSFVGDIEVGVEGLDEGVSEDEGFSELGRKVQSHNANNANWFFAFLDLQDVVFSLEGVGISSDYEVKVGEGGHDGAIDLFLLAWSESFGHFLNNFGGADEDGCSSVDNTDEVSDFVAGSVEDEIVHSDLPVVSTLEGVILELSSVVLGIDSSQDEGRSVWAGNAGKVEGEGVTHDLALLDQEVEDEGEAVDWDAGPGHAEDTVELWGQEADSVESGDLGEEGVLGGEAGEPGGVLSNEAWDSTWAVGNVEVGAVIDVGGTLGRVEIFVKVAGGRESALFGGHPEVGGTCIEDDSELLGGSADIDLSR